MPPFRIPLRFAPTVLVFLVTVWCVCLMLVSKHYGGDDNALKFAWYGLIYFWTGTIWGGIATLLILPLSWGVGALLDSGRGTRRFISGKWLNVSAVCIAAFALFPIITSFPVTANYSSGSDDGGEPDPQGPYTGDDSPLPSGRFSRRLPLYSEGFICGHAKAPGSNAGLLAQRAQPSQHSHVGFWADHSLSDPVFPIVCQPPPRLLRPYMFW